MKKIITLPPFRAKLNKAETAYFICFGDICIGKAGKSKFYLFPGLKTMFFTVDELLQMGALVECCVNVFSKIEDNIFFTCVSSPRHGKSYTVKNYENATNTKS